MYAIRQFLERTRLVDHSEVLQEAPSGTGRVDLQALDTVIEVKRRIGSTELFSPNPDHIAQLDRYLRNSEGDGRGVRVGILTDGVHWLLRWPGGKEVKTAPPHGFSLDRKDDGGLVGLHEWLRDHALQAVTGIPIDRDGIVSCPANTRGMIRGPADS